MEIDDIKKLANLARIEMTDGEMEALKGDFGPILEYVDKIREVSVPKSDTKEVYPKQNTFREDEPSSFDSEKRDNIIAGFPDREGDYLKINTVLKND